MEEIPIVLIGHKDHGKSTLIGRLILDTGSVKSARVEEIKKIDEDAGRMFELAHLVDSFREEREREMTMDTTRAVLKGKKGRNYQLIDVPGHGELIQHMLTGASNAQAALLMVSAFEGIEDQTKQHLEIIKLLGINQLAVLVNKLDRFDFAQIKFQEITQQLESILLGIGFTANKINYFPVSAFLGDNIVKRSEKTAWYAGPTVMEFIENEVIPPVTLDDLPVRFLVQDKYDLAEQDILVGRVLSGTLKVGDRVTVLPQKEEQEISALKETNGDIQEAKANSNIGLVLKQNTLGQRGSVISSINNPALVANQIKGEVFWITAPRAKELTLECGTAQTAGELMNDLPSQNGVKTDFMFACNTPMVYDSNGSTILSKIVFKQNGQLIGVGTVE